MAAAQRPKANGEPIRVGSLGSMFDAYGFVEQGSQVYHDHLWIMGGSGGTRFRGSFCLSSATTLMKNFRKGLKILMGTRVTQDECFPFEVITDFLEISERHWQEVHRRFRLARDPRDKQDLLLRMHDIACATTYWTLYTMTCARPGELDLMLQEHLRGWLKIVGSRAPGKEWSLEYVDSRIDESKVDQEAEGYPLYLAQSTASGLKPAKWMGRLRRVSKSLGFKKTDYALSKGKSKKLWSGASIMTYLIVPQLEAIAAASPQMPSTSYLRSVDWTRIRARSLRRTGIHRLRILGTKTEIIDYFGRWKVHGKSPMQPRYDRLAIRESVMASAAM